MIDEKNSPETYAYMLGMIAYEISCDVQTAIGRGAEDKTKISISAPLAVAKRWIEVLQYTSHRLVEFEKVQALSNIPPSQLQKIVRQETSNG